MEVVLSLGIVYWSIGDFRRGFRGNGWGRGSFCFMFRVVWVLERLCGFFWFNEGYGIGGGGGGLEVLNLVWFLGVLFIGIESGSIFIDLIFIFILV